MTDKLLTIEKQIQRLKKKRNKLYTQQAFLFFKEVEKIFKDGFCPNLVLDILTLSTDTCRDNPSQAKVTLGKHFKNFKTFTGTPPRKALHSRRLSHMMQVSEEEMRL